MRRSGAATLLAIMGLMVGEMLLIPAVGQSPAGSPGSKQTVAAYFNTVVRPVLVNKYADEDRLRTFYQTGLSDRTRAPVSEDQFVAFWRQAAAGMQGPFGGVDLRELSVGDPIESEAADQALVPVAGEASWWVRTVPVNLVLGCVFVLGQSQVSAPGCSSDFPPPVDADHRLETVYLVAREGGAWKLVLHQDLAREMQKIKTTGSARRYVVDAAAVQDGIGLRVHEVSVAEERAAISFTLVNNTETEARSLNALALATLTDERGQAHDVRILRSRIPEVAEAGSTVPVELVFDPVPLDSRRLTLSVTGIELGSREVSLRREITLLPYAGGRGTPVPGESAYLFLLTVLRLPFRQESTLRSVYRVQLAQSARAQFSERQFLEYYASDTAGRLACRWGMPGSFTVGLPAYNAAKDQAAIDATIRYKSDVLRPGEIIPSTVAFRVAKEGGAWKLVLPEQIAADIKTPRPPTKRQFRVAVRDPRPGGGQEFGGLRLDVDTVIVSTRETLVTLMIYIDRNYKFEFIEPRFGTYLEVSGRRYRLTSGLWIPPWVMAENPLRLPLTFEPIPMSAQEVSLAMDYHPAGGAVATAVLDLELKAQICPDTP